jgi:hypothetical protein
MRQSTSSDKRLASRVSAGSQSSRYLLEQPEDEQNEPPDE